MGAVTRVTRVTSSSSQHMRLPPALSTALQHEWEPTNHPACLPPDSWQMMAALPSTATTNQ
jgi:hypothetical protein